MNPLVLAAIVGALGAGLGPPAAVSALAEQLAPRPAPAPAPARTDDQRQRVDAATAKRRRRAERRLRGAR